MFSTELPAPLSNLLHVHLISIEVGIVGRCDRQIEAESCVCVNQYPGSSLEKKTDAY